MLHRAGKGALLKLPDALGRNPPDRDDLILARTGEWTQLRSAIRGVSAAIQRGEFDDDEPEPYVLPANSMAFDAAREAEARKAAERGDGRDSAPADPAGAALPASKAKAKAKAHAGSPGDGSVSVLADVAGTGSVDGDGILCLRAKEAEAIPQPSSGPSIVMWEIVDDDPEPSPTLGELHCDADGDEAHEFWHEDPRTGRLVRTGGSRLEPGVCELALVPYRGAYCPPAPSSPRGSARVPESVPEPT